MSRPRGSRNRLVTLDYDVIGELVGIRGSTARRYAHRHEYNSRNLTSVMEWINRRRAAQGLPLIGIPDGDRPAVSDDTPTPAESPEDIKPTAIAGGLLVYDPLSPKNWARLCSGFNTSCGPVPTSSRRPWLAGCGCTTVKLSPTYGTN